MIESYQFGSVVIAGQKHTKDCIVHRDDVTSWWRKKGHSVAVEDLEILIAHGPQALVIGTGAYGMMKVPEPTRRFIEDAGVHLTVCRTKRAVAEFNRLRDDGVDAALAMHLTC
jgi:hypothetical protein